MQPCIDAINAKNKTIVNIDFGTRRTDQFGVLIIKYKNILLKTKSQYISTTISSWDYFKTYTMTEKSKSNVLTDYESELEKVVDDIRSASTSLIGVMILNEYLSNKSDDE